MEGTWLMHLRGLAVRTVGLVALFVASSGGLGPGVAQAQMLAPPPVPPAALTAESCAGTTDADVLGAFAALSPGVRISLTNTRSDCVLTLTLATWTLVDRAAIGVPDVSSIRALHAGGQGALANEIAAKMRQAPQFPSGVWVISIPPLQTQTFTREYNDPCADHQVDLYLGRSLGGQVVEAGIAAPVARCSSPRHSVEFWRGSGGCSAVLQSMLLDWALVRGGAVALGDLTVSTCGSAAKLLAGSDLAGGAHPRDLAYTLAAHLLAAQLNLRGGAERCSKLTDAIAEGQRLLGGTMHFTGSGAYAEPGRGTDDLRGQLAPVVEALATYNEGGLCGGG